MGLGVPFWFRGVFWVSCPRDFFLVFIYVMSPFVFPCHLKSVVALYLIKWVLVQITQGISAWAPGRNSLFNLQGAAELRGKKQRPQQQVFTFIKCSQTTLNKNIPPPPASLENDIWYYCGETPDWGESSEVWVLTDKTWPISHKKYHIAIQLVL